MPYVRKSNSEGGGRWGVGTSDLIFVQKKTPVSDFTPSVTEEELIDELTSCSLRV